MYLKRKADAYLNAWKSDPNRSPLIIKGPRQAGKDRDYRLLCRTQLPFGSGNPTSLRNRNIAQSLRTVMARIPSSAIFP